MRDLVGVVLATADDDEVLIATTFVFGPAVVPDKVGSGSGFGVVAICTCG